MLKRWLYRWMEPEIEAAITNCLLLFHDALVRRGQVPEPPIEVARSVPTEKPNLRVVENNGDFL